MGEATGDADRTAPLLRRSEQVTLLVLALAAGVLLAVGAAGGSAVAPHKADEDGLRLRLDPNRANMYELMHLPEVGESTARRIIRGRPYATVQQLRRVKYIGPKKLARIRPHVAIGSPRRQQAR